MVVETTALLGLPVISASSARLGTVDRCLFDPKGIKLAALQVPRGIGRKVSSLDFRDVLPLTRRSLIVDSDEALKSNLDGLDELHHRAGPVLGTVAKTESGRRLGRVGDVLIESETGGIVRFYLRNFLPERIIPRQYLVSINPKAIIFKDVVDQPIFNQLASAENPVLST